jgi:hypothetical protein
MTLPELTVRTRSAHWGWDEHRYFGHGVFEELTGSESMTSLMVLSVLGRRLPADCCSVLDDAAAALTLADPRIWPLKLTRVVAAYGSPIPALCAGMLLENEARIGPWAFIEASRALIELHSAIGEAAGDAAHVEGVVARYLAEHAFVWGFGTPFRARDERLVAFRRCIQLRGRDVLPHWKTMEAVAAAVSKAKNAEANMGIAVAATLLDMGLDPQEILMLVVALMQHMFFAHALDGVRSDATVLRKLPDNYVRYAGRSARTSPRAKEADLMDAKRAPADGIQRGTPPM